MSAVFTERYRVVVESLFACKLSGTEGYATLPVNTMPVALSEFYLLLGYFAPVTSAHNRFLPADSFQVVGDKIVFCEENQVVVRWGYDRETDEPDPPIYQTMDDRHWPLEANRCSDFLVGMIYWQALHGGLPLVEHRYQVNQLVREAARTHWPLVWQDADTQVYSKGAIVFSLSRARPGFDVVAAGMSEAGLNEVWLTLGLLES